MAEQVVATPAHAGLQRASPRIQPCSAHATGSEAPAPASVDRVISSAGSPLEAGLRQDMERRFDFDFSRVRVHHDVEAEQSARDVNANAYTVGHHVVFGEGRFAPDTHEGRRLVAHELTHVVQQTGHELTHVVQQARSPITRIQRAPNPPTIKPAPGGQQRQEYEIERRWKQLKSAASGFKAISGWITAGDAAIARALEHESGYLSAIQAKDAALAVAYKQLIETDLTAYRYVSWHVFVYQNLSRLQSSWDSLVSSLNNDKRNFTGRENIEKAIRVLQDLIKKVPEDSAVRLAALETDVPYKFRQGTAQEVAMKVTSAAYKNKGKALESETRAIKKIQLHAQVIIENVNDFLRTARKEGLKQAFEAVKEYYLVRKGILDAEDNDPDVSNTQQSGSGSGSGSAGQGAGSGSAGQGAGSGSAGQGAGSGSAGQGAGSGSAGQGAGSGSGEQGSGSGSAGQGSGSGSGQGSGSGSAPRKTCKEVAPDKVRCDSLPPFYNVSGRNCFSASAEGVKRLQQGETIPLTRGNQQKADTGPCVGKGGEHFNIQRGSFYIGAIVCCPCCKDALSGPDEQCKCGFIRKKGDTRVTEPFPT